MEKEKTNVMSQEELDEMYSDIGMTAEEFDAMMEKSFEEIKKGTSLPFDEAVAELDRRIAETESEIMETNKDTTILMSQEELEEMYADIGMTSEEFDAMMEKSFTQIKNGQSRPAEEFWAELDVIMEKDLQDEYNRNHLLKKVV